MRLLIVTALGLVLAGCNTTGPKLPEEMSYADLDALGHQIIQRCVDQGVAIDSQEMDTCFEHEARRERGQRLAARQDREDNRAALRNLGNAMMAAGAQSSPQRTNCIQTMMGFNCTTR